MSNESALFVERAFATGTKTMELVGEVSGTRSLTLLFQLRLRFPQS